MMRLLLAVLVVLQVKAQEAVVSINGSMHPCRGLDRSLCAETDDTTGQPVAQVCSSMCQTERSLEGTNIIDTWCKDDKFQAQVLQKQALLFLRASRRKAPVNRVQAHLLSRRVNSLPILAKVRRLDRVFRMTSLKAQANASPVGILDKREVEFGKLFAGIKIDDTMLVTVSLPSVSPLSKEDAQTTMRLVEAWMNKVYGTRHGRILLQSENDFITEIEFLDQSVSVDDDGSPICLFRYRQRVSYT